jgi:hypothetical protein
LNRLSVPGKTLVRFSFNLKAQEIRPIFSAFSMSADRAARQILNAVRRRKSDLVIKLPVRAGITAQALFPNFVARIVKLIARFLPQKPTLAQNENLALSPDCDSWFVPRV